VKRFLFPAVAVLISTSLGLGVLELFARLVLPPPAVVQTDFKAGLPEGKETKAAEGIYVETAAGLRMRPNAEVTIHYATPVQRDVTIKTNSIGYRERELGAKKKKRVLFLGASITFGMFVEAEETFVRRIEALSKDDTAPLETINSALESVDAEAELAILQETGLALKPDVVVLDFSLHDFAPSPSFKVTRVPRFLTKSWLVYYVVTKALPLVSQRLGRSSLYRLNKVETKLIDDELKARLPAGPGDPLKDPKAFNRLIIEQSLDWGGAWSEAAWSKMQPVFDKLAALSKREGFQLLIVGFPVRYQVQADFVEDYPQRKLKETAERLGIPLLDLLPPLRQAERHMAGRGKDLFYDNIHFSLDGHAFASREIHDFILRSPRR
jgi:hypothetical protein